MRGRSTSPFKVLGQVRVPRDVNANLDALFRAYPPKGDDISQLDIGPREEGAWRHHADPAKTAFLAQTLRQFGLEQRIEREDALLMFRDVGLHSDTTSTAVYGIPVRFVHIVLRGSGSFQVPDAVPPGHPGWRLSRGMVFQMNPLLEHRVVGASRNGIACLTAVVPC